MNDAVLATLLRRHGTSPPEALALALASFVERGRRAWPRVTAVEPERFADYLERKVTPGLELLAALGTLDAGELWLCTACAEGSSVAHAGFEARYVASLDPSLRAMGLDEAAIDDVKQRTRDKLLIAAEDGAPRMLAYVGEGRLGGLVKVAAMRVALDELRSRQRRPELGRAADASAVERLMAGELGPEMRVLDQEHREVVKAAFGSAIDSLSSTDRGILRLHLLERLSIDEIAALHDVHRATAARWLTRLRRELGEHTRESLRARLRLDSRELESVMRAAGSRLDLSLSRVLAPSAGDDPDRERA